MERRRILPEQALEVLRFPQQQLGSGDRQVYQSRYHDALEGKEMLLRVVAELRQEDLFVVTIYKTSKIRKYWIGDSQ